MSTSSALRAASLVVLLAAAPALAQVAVPAQPAPAPPPSAYPPPTPYPPGTPPPAAAPPPVAQPSAYPPPAAVVVAPPPQHKRLQLSAFTGWQMNGDVSVYAGNLVIDDAMNYGVSLDFSPAPGTGFQLLWIYNDTTAHFVSYDLFYPSTRDFSLQQHYFQIGGNKGFRRGNLEPFGGGTLGAALFVPGTIQTVNGAQVSSSDTWAFAMTFGAGVKVFFSEKIALRLEGRLMLPMFFSGGSFYVGTGGSGMAVSAGIPSIQGCFTAGLTFAP